jgi:hypothetical protein
MKLAAVATITRPAAVQSPPQDRPLQDLAQCFRRFEAASGPDRHTGRDLRRLQLVEPPLPEFLYGLDLILDGLERLLEGINYPERT